jgi:hypothetical protein
LTQADLRTYDLRDAVERFSGHGVNVFVVFGIGYLGGESYYPSSVAPSHPQLGDRDFLQEACEATSKIGAACIAYVNSLFGGPDSWQSHPDWMQQRPDGSLTEMGDARAMCPLSPYGDRIIAAVEEIASRYSVQGMYFDEPSFQSWCACTFCKTQFLQDTGAALPLQADEDDPAWTLFVAWRYEKVTNFVQRAAEAFRRHRPESAFWCQHAFPMTSTVVPVMRKLFEGMLPSRVPAITEGWSRTLYYGQRIEQQVASLDVLSAELWRRFADRPIWWPGAAVNYLKSIAGDRPVLAFLEYPDFPWSLRPVPDDELEFMVVNVRANGGHSWFPLYAPGASDERGWAAIATVHHELETFDHGQGQLTAEVIVGYSPSTADLRSVDDVERDYLDGVIGTLQLLRDSHIPHSLVSLDLLEEGRLADIQTLVIPGAAALPESTVQVIEEYVTSGGSLLLLGDVGTHDGNGVRRSVGALQSMIGARSGCELRHLGIAYLQWKDDTMMTNSSRVFPVRGVVPTLEVGEAEVLGMIRIGYNLFEAPPDEVEELPAVTRSRRGAGSVVSCLVDVGALARRYHAPGVDEFFRALLDATGHTAKIRLIAPPSVTLCPWKTEKGWVLYLLNQTGIEEHGHVTPVGPVTVSIPRSSETRRATLHANGIDAKIEFLDHGEAMLTTRVEVLGVWAVIEITEEENA